MPSTYTLNNGIELIATGEQSGTWGDTTNTNLSLVDTALDGQVTVTLPSAGTSGSPNTLAISDGAASDGRNRMVIFNDGGDLGATAYVQLTPNDAEKIIYVRNDLAGSRSIILFQGTYNASNDYELPAGTTAVIYFDGAGSGAVAANVFNNAYFDSLRLGSVSVTAIIDDDTMATASATNIATSESIKAYVDTQVGANNELSEVLANGNTTGGTDISVSSGDDITFADSSKAIFGAGSDLQIYHDGSNSRILEAGTGFLAIGTNGTEISLRGDNFNDFMLKAEQNSAVTLYHNALPKLATTSTGIDVTGTVTADGLTVEDADGATIRIQSSDTSVDGGSLGQLEFYSNDASIGGTGVKGKIQVSDNGSSGQNYEMNFFTGYVTGGATAETKKMSIGPLGDISFYEDTGTTAKFFWDASAESLGIGTSSPSYPLTTLAGTANTQVAQFTGTDVGRGLRIETASTTRSDDTAILNASDAFGELAFETNSTERMRIDSSGNLLVGVTSSSANMAGLELAANGQLYASTSSSSGHFFNRQSTDGAIVSFRKDGTTVGSIGVESNAAYFAGVTYGIKPYSAGIAASNSSGVFADGTADLGKSNIRFKDLYLSNSTQYGTSGTDSFVVGKSGSENRIWDRNGQPITFLTGDLERMRIDSSGNVGIGTSSPAVLSHVAAGYTAPTGGLDAGIRSLVSSTGYTGLGILSASNASAYVHFGDPDDSDVGGIIYGHSSNHMQFNVNASERMRIDSSGNLLIKTAAHTPTDTELVVASEYSASATTDAGITLSARQGGNWRNSGIFANGDALTFTTGDLGTNGAISTSEKMRIDSSGNVGIGVSAPSDSTANGNNLVIGGESNVGMTFLSSSTTGSGDIYFADGTSGSDAYRGIISYAHTNDSMLFYINGGSEAMRIDSSGNLLVGTTDPLVADGTNGGLVLGGQRDLLHVSRVNAPPVKFSRANNDGDIVVFAKDGSTVGSIGTDGALNIGSTNTGIKFGTSAVWATTGGSTNSNGAKDLGASTVRWKDLYLSGGVYLGGTGAANKLDDYEEGTYTPVVNTESGTAYTLSTANGYYRKVGSLVHIEVDITFTAEGSGTITLISLPFTPRGNTEIINGYVTSGANRRSIQLTHYSGANVLVRVDDGSAFQNYWTAKSTWAPTNSFRFAGTYIDNS